MFLSAVSTSFSVISTEVERSRVGRRDCLPATLELIDKQMLGVNGHGFFLKVISSLGQSRAAAEARAKRRTGSSSDLPERRCAGRWCEKADFFSGADKMRTQPTLYLPIRNSRLLLRHGAVVHQSLKTYISCPVQPVAKATLLCRAATTALRNTSMSIPNAAAVEATPTGPAAVDGGRTGPPLRLRPGTVGDNWRS